jgi:hypothetical protein
VDNYTAPYTNIPNIIFDMLKDKYISHMEYIILTTLFRWKYSQNKMLSYSYIAVATSYSESKVKDSIKSLVDKGLVLKHKHLHPVIGNLPNTYEVNGDMQWVSKDKNVITYGGGALVPSGDKASSPQGTEETNSSSSSTGRGVDITPPSFINNSFQGRYSNSKDTFTLYSCSPKIIKEDKTTVSGGVVEASQTQPISPDAEVARGRAKVAQPLANPSPTELELIEAYLADSGDVDLLKPRKGRQDHLDALVATFHQNSYSESETLSAVKHLLPFVIPHTKGADYKTWCDDVKAQWRVAVKHQFKIGKPKTQQAGLPKSNPDTVNLDVTELFATFT